MLTSQLLGAMRTTLVSDENPPVNPSSTHDPILGVDVL